MSNLKYIYDELKKEGFCDNGIYGLMGNLQEESGFRANNLQNSFQKKLGHTDESYTKAVDDGSYQNFVKDGAGYGLAQWTYWSRKQSLLLYAQSLGKSIGDFKMQVAFMIAELKGYKAVYNVLKNAKSIKEASDVVITKYEQPADQSDKAKEKRVKNAEEVKAILEAEEEMAKMSIRDKVLAICNQELGTGEPTGDDKYIDWFNKNILKTWSFSMSVAWCHIFATYAGVMAGLTKNEMPMTAGCDEGMNWFKNRKQWKDSLAYGGNYIPKKGDMVYYSSTHNQNDSTHVGWCKSCDGTLMVVAEGNYSNKVKERTIYLSDPYILGFGIINFPDEEKKDDSLSNPLRGSGIGTAVALATMNVRTGPGTSYTPVGYISKGKSVEVLAIEENNWLKVVWDIAEGGFAYVSNAQPYFDVTWNNEGFKPKEEYTIGTIVQFNGNKHYSSSASTKGKSCKPGRAKISQYAPGKIHPYHLVATGESTSNVYGWVDASDVSPLPQNGYTPWVGKVDNCSVLNVRTGAGTEYGKLQAWPQLRKGNLVDVLGEVKASTGKTWYYVSIQGNKGYVHSAYIAKG